MEQKDVYMENLPGIPFGDDKMTIDDTIECPYCLEFAHKLPKPILHTIGWPYRKRILYETAQTVIVPTIGSIVPNYLLLIPLRHTYAIRYLQTEEIDDLYKCILMLEERFDGGTFFEHGSIDSKLTSGASIDHVHLHYLPIDIDIKTLTPEFTYTELDDFKSITTIEEEYIFVRVRFRGYWIKAKSLPSQYLRRTIARLFGVPAMWNWREYPFVCNMIATYNSWL